MRPVKKSQILRAKIFTVAFVALLLLFVLVVVSLLIGFIFFGVGDGSAVNVTMGVERFIVKTSLLIDILNTSLIVLLQLFTYGIISVFVAAVSRKESIATMITMSIWLLGGIAMSFLELNSAYSFLIIFESLQYVGDLSITSFHWTPTVLKYIVTILVYDLLFIFLTMIFFQRQTFASLNKR